MTTKTARYLTRFEDAEVSRQQLLALQKHPLKGQPTIAEKVLEKHQKKRLKKRLRGKGGRIAKGKRGVSEAIKGRPKADEDLEVMRDKQRAAKAEGERKDAEIRAIDRQAALTDLQARAEGVRRDRELTIADRTQQAIVQVAQLRFGLGGAADVISQREVQQRIADRQAQAQLEDRRQQLAVQQIAAGHLEGRRQRGLEHRRVNEEARRHNREVADRQQERGDTHARHAADLAGIQERVAREDERRHAEQRLQFEQAATELAERGAARQREQENERFRIESQRAVDAGRTHRGVEGDRQQQETLREMMTLLQRQGGPEFFHTGGLPSVPRGGGGGGGGGGQLRREPSAIPELVDAWRSVLGEQTLERQRRGEPPPDSPLSLSPQSRQSERELVPDRPPPRTQVTSPSPYPRPAAARPSSPTGHYRRRSGTPQRAQPQPEPEPPASTLQQQGGIPALPEEEGMSRSHRLRGTPSQTEHSGEFASQQEVSRHLQGQRRVGGSEDDRPEGLDRAGGGRIEDVANDGSLGDEDT